MLQEVLNQITMFHRCHNETPYYGVSLWYLSNIQGNHSGGSRGVPRVPWNPPFGFSCDRKLWKPGLQQNPTVKTVTTN